MVMHYRFSLLRALGDPLMTHSLITEYVQAARTGSGSRCRASFSRTDPMIITHRRVWVIHPGITRVHGHCVAQGPRATSITQCCRALIDMVKPTGVLPCAPWREGLKNLEARLQCVVKKQLALAGGY